jgi:hypothetical protein
MEQAIILRERKVITPKQKMALVLSGVFLLGLGVGSFWLYHGGIYRIFPAMEQARLIAELDARLTAYRNNPPPFVYTVVPTASTTLKVPPPQSEDIDIITRDYIEAKNALPSVLPESPSSISEFVVGDIGYEEFLNMLPPPVQKNWFQIHSEVRQLVASLNRVYNVPPLLSRIGTTTPVLYPDELSVFGTAVPSTYPSLRVVEGYVTAGLLSRVFPNQATDYEAMATAYAREGIAFGHYSYRDLTVSRTLAEEYLSLVTDDVIMGAN